jgi:hypothetical protein
MPIDDLKPALQINEMRTNIFSVSDRDTANTTDDTCKYYNTSVNFNQIDQGK